MGKLTEARREVLSRCVAPSGLRPVWHDWYAVYWLKLQGYVTDDAKPRKHRHYRITEAGRHALQSEGGSNDD